VTVFPSLSTVGSWEEVLLFSMDFTVSQNFWDLELQDENFCLKKLSFAFLTACVYWFLTSLRMCISRGLFDASAVMRSCLRHGITVLAVPLEILDRVQALSQPAPTGRPIGRRTIGPASSGLGEGLAGRDVLVPSRTSKSCGRPDAMHADTVARCTLFPLTMLPG
jgi:hypothetical protein